MKTCNKCNIEKSLNDFARDISKKDGYKPSCSDCYNKIRRERNKLHNFSVTIKEYECHSCNLIKPVEEFHKNKAHHTGLSIVCKLCRVQRSERHYQRHKEKIQKRTRKYIDENPEKVKETRRKYQKRKMQTDPLYVMTRRLRNRLYYAMLKKFWKKDTKFFQYIGCSLEELKAHIESQFLSGMSWDNRAEWHLDHKIPLVSAKNEEELYKLCHYTNIQPLWGADNIKKGSKNQ